MRSISFLFTVLGLLTGAALAAEDKPDFSGNWKLDIEKSDFGSFPAPRSASMKVDHKDPKLNLTSNAATQMGNHTVDLKLMTDGTETENEISGTPVKNRAHWEGRLLVVESKIATETGEVTAVDRWLLSSDRKTLTLERKWSGTSGDSIQRLVHTKE